MRDFPIFTTEFGVASLILREIPYRQRAYIKLLDSLEPERLLDECRGFCTAVGAQHIFASGHAVLENYPLYARILRLECNRADLPLTTARTAPVTEQSVERWRQIYNEKMSDVPNASYMDSAGAKELLAGGSGYFVYCDDELIGIGKTGEGTLDALASIRPGAGQAVVCALAKVLTTDVIGLQVAAENTRAMALYQRLGFTEKEELSRWYQII